ncbi:hypothetical protein [Bacillus gaemokensis]|uniref:Uncharacterized protein n=1 Tax=Bacillus gaemokensis TaxID=574375 RepID=A0A073KCT7_9BACI|nr:hypothetical protein [Bacillus gaemokensis]KEK24331.1 hypothetical protein BAGA_26680 [Bacillus gaemokensis]KYG38308.1 hypothetical protein AZF08_18405 [Bacillus gaemokensis]
MEDISWRILIGAGRGAVGMIKFAGDFLLDEVVEQAFEKLAEGEERKKKRIQRHVEKLKGYTWFKTLYEDKRCQEVILCNQVYKNLLSKRRYIHRLIYKEEERKKFIQRVNS